MQFRSIILIFTITLTAPSLYSQRSNSALELRDLSFNGIPFSGSIPKDLDTSKYAIKGRGPGRLLLKDFYIAFDPNGHYEILSCEMNTGNIKIGDKEISSSTRLSTIESMFPDGAYYDTGEGTGYFGLYIDTTKGVMPLPVTIRFQMYKGKITRVYLHTSC